MHAHEAGLELVLRSRACLTMQTAGVQRGLVWSGQTVVHWAVEPHGHQLMMQGGCGGCSPPQMTGSHTDRGSMV